MPVLCTPFNKLSDYFSACALYINQTNRVPPILSFPYYSKKSFSNYPIAPTTRLLTSSIDKIITMCKKRSLSLVELFSFVLFVTFSCNDNTTQVQAFYELFISILQEKNSGPTYFVYPFKRLALSVNMKAISSLPVDLQNSFEQFIHNVRELLNTK